MSSGRRHAVGARAVRRADGQAGGCEGGVHRRRLRRPGQADEQAGNDDSGGNRRVGDHVQEGPADIDVMVPAAGEQPGGDAVDEDADAGDGDKHAAIGRLRIA